VKTHAHARTRTHRHRSQLQRKTLDMSTPVGDMILNSVRAFQVPSTTRLRRILELMQALWESHFIASPSWEKLKKADLATA